MEVWTSRCSHLFASLQSAFVAHRCWEALIHLDIETGLRLCLLHFHSNFKGDFKSPARVNFRSDFTIRFRFRAVEAEQMRHEHETCHFSLGSLKGDFDADNACALHRPLYNTIRRNKLALKLQRTLQVACPGDLKSLLKTPLKWPPKSHKKIASVWECDFNKKVISYYNPRPILLNFSHLHSS